MIKMFIMVRCRPTLPESYKGNTQNPVRTLFIDVIKIFITERCRPTPTWSYKVNASNSVKTLLIYRFLQGQCSKLSPLHRHDCDVHQGKIQVYTTRVLQSQHSKSSKNLLHRHDWDVQYKKMQTYPTRVLQGQHSISSKNPLHRYD